MNLKALIIGAFLALAPLSFSYAGQDVESPVPAPTCQLSTSAATQNLLKGWEQNGIKDGKLYIFSGEQVQEIREWLAKKYTNGDVTKLREFDFLAVALRGDNAMAVAGNGGCVQKIFPVPTSDVKEIVDLVQGKQAN